MPKLFVLFGAVGKYEEWYASKRDHTYITILLNNVSTMMKVINFFLFKFKLKFEDLSLHVYFTKSNVNFKLNRSL